MAALSKGDGRHIVSPLAYDFEVALLRLFWNIPKVALLFFPGSLPSIFVAVVLRSVTLWKISRLFSVGVSVCVRLGFVEHHDAMDGGV